HLLEFLCTFRFLRREIHFSGAIAFASRLVRSLHAAPLKLLTIALRADLFGSFDCTCTVSVFDADCTLRC
ncbi:MAG: hypothetical protein ACYTX0_55390, partial [Nostoc sp.]